MHTLTASYYREINFNPIWNKIYYNVIKLTLFSRLIFVFVFETSPECFTSNAMRRTNASRAWKHFVRTNVGVFGVSARIR